MSIQLDAVEGERRATAPLQRKGLDDVDALRSRTHAFHAWLEKQPPPAAQAVAGGGRNVARAAAQAQNGLPELGGLGLGGTGGGAAVASG